MARRKEIYLELHPETKAGVAGGKTGGNGREKVANDILSFATDTAAKTGKSKRTVERKAKNGKKLKGMAAKIKAAGIDDSQKDLTELAKLVDKSPEQAQTIEIDALRQLGDMLKATDRAKGTAGVLRGRDSSGGTKMEPPEKDAPTLSDLGINKKTSSLAQKLATLPETSLLWRKLFGRDR